MPHHGPDTTNRTTLQTEFDGTQPRSYLSLPYYTNQTLACTSIRVWSITEAVSLNLTKRRTAAVTSTRKIGRTPREVHVHQRCIHNILVLPRDRFCVRFNGLNRTETKQMVIVNATNIKTHLI